MRTVQHVRFAACAVAALAASTTGLSASARAAQTMHGTYTANVSEVNYNLSTRGSGTMRGFGRFTIRESLEDQSSYGTSGGSIAFAFRGPAVFTFASGIQLRAVARTSGAYATDLSPVRAGVRIMGTTVYTLSGGTGRFADASGTLATTFSGSVTRGGLYPPTILRLAGSMTGHFGAGYRHQLHMQLAKRYDTVYAPWVGEAGGLSVHATARSSPSGRGPNGSAGFHIGGGLGPTYDGPVTCLSVKRNVAVIGFLAGDPVAAVPPQEQTMQLVERGASRSDTVMILAAAPGTGSQSRSPTDCSSIAHPTYTLTAAHGGPLRPTAIFDADMPANRECQAVEDVGGLSLLGARTMSCGQARAVVLAVESTVAPGDASELGSSQWGRAYIAATPEGRFQCQREQITSVTHDIRCTRGRARVAWFTVER